MITNDFPPGVGGIENYAFSLARRWDPRDITVLTRWMPGCAPFDREADFEIIREPVGTLLPTPGLFRRAKSIVKGAGIDAVHFPSSLPLGLMGSRLRRPYACSVHGGEFVLSSRLPAARQALKAVCAGAALLLPESSFAERLIHHFIRDPRAVERVTCGVDAERYGRPRTRALQREAPGSTIICLSRVIPRKGQNTLIRTLPALLGSHPGIRLWIVGGGPYLPKLRKLAGALGVERAVTFAGPQPWESTPDFLSAADIFALPTRDRFLGTETEGLPLALLEAAAAGLPLVAGNVGGIPDAVRPGQTGILVDGSSIVETATALAQLLDDPSLAVRLGARGRKMVVEEFTWDKVFERYRAAITACCI